jgi:hypothetical protein
MRAEMIDIHITLTRFDDYSWLGIFTNSFFSLHSIRFYFNNLGLSTSPHYHHHMLLLKNTFELLEISRENDQYTTLRTKIRHCTRK